MEIAGRYSEYVRLSDEGERRRFYFCPDCGATVFYKSESAPDTIAVPVGAFADPEFPAPRVAVYGDRRHGWLTLADSIDDRH